MRICFAVFSYDPGLASCGGAEYLCRVPLYRELPQRLAARGHRVEVVHAFPRDLDYAEGRVRYHFVSAGRLARGFGYLGEHLLGRRRSEVEIAREAVGRVVDLAPEIVHFSGVTLHLNLALLLRRLPPDVRLVVHHHGGSLSSRWPARRFQARSLRRTSRVLVTTRSHADPFVDAGVLTCDHVVELMETSSTLQWRPRPEVRRETGMQGDPVFLSAGRLHPLKDPFTLLRGFERIAAAWPGARLYLYYLSGELEEEARAWVAGRPGLRGRLEFRGRVSRPEMEAVMNSADFLLQASRREWSGIAVLDAMACGVIPVVTDIPAFRAMTDGLDGLLFPVGDAEALARRVLAFEGGEIAGCSAAVRRHFEQRWSFARLAAKLEAIYQDVLRGP